MFKYTYGLDSVLNVHRLNAISMDRSALIEMKVDVCKIAVET